MESEVIQSLWSGYGKIVRCGLEGRTPSDRSHGVRPSSVVVKHVHWPDFPLLLQGWSPGHWKIHRYSERLAHEVLEQLT